MINPKSEILNPKQIQNPKFKRKITIALIVLLLLAIYKTGFSHASETEEKNINFISVNDENYKAEVLDYNGPLMVFFYAEWCPYSDTLIPRYTDIEKKYYGRIKFCRYPLNIAYKNFQSPQGLKLWQGLNEKYNVKTIPTIIMFNKAREIDRMCGRPETELMDAYRQFFSEWIESNIINPQDNPYRFNGKLLLQKRKE